MNRVDEDLKNFIWDLGKEGFVLQLVSLAGLHLNAAATAELASRFKTDGMLAYVDLVQKKEKEIGCDVLTHQKWYADLILLYQRRLIHHCVQERSQLRRPHFDHSFCWLIEHIGSWQGFD